VLTVWKKERFACCCCCWWWLWRCCCYRFDIL